MKKRILLTGDDGHTSIGTRLLVHFLRKDFDLTIAGTMTQQSGVGGFISARDGGRYEETEIDGIPALLVDGHPVDAIELAKSWYPKPFDLVVSGINWGTNIGAAFISSGTMAAAMRSLSLGLAPKSIAISWLLTEGKWHEDHDGTEDISRYLVYPGEIAHRVIHMSIKNNLWGNMMLNINLPEKISDRVRFTKFLPDITDFYRYPMTIDRKKKRFAYSTGLSKHLERGIQYDSGAILSGYISITPCTRDITNNMVYKHFARKTFTLDP